MRVIVKNARFKEEHGKDSGMITLSADIEKNGELLKDIDVIVRKDGYFTCPADNQLNSLSPECQNTYEELLQKAKLRIITTCGYGEDFF